MIWMSHNFRAAVLITIGLICASRQLLAGGDTPVASQAQLAPATNQVQSIETAPAFATNAPPKRVPAVKINKPGLKNFYRISDNLYRSAQPTAQGLREAEKMGIKTIINLRSTNTDRKALVGTQLRYEHIACSAWRPNDGEAVRFLRIVTDTNAWPVLVHCQHGSDRTGTMVAIYRMAVQGWLKNDAIAEMTSGGFGFHAIYQNLVRYLKKLDLEKIKRQAGIKPVS